MPAVREPLLLGLGLGIAGAGVEAYDRLDRVRNGTSRTRS
jgi:hypothetical protein